MSPSGKVKKKFPLPAVTPSFGESVLRQPRERERERKKFLLKKRSSLGLFSFLWNIPTTLACLVMAASESGRKTHLKDN